MKVQMRHIKTKDFLHMTEDNQLMLVMLFRDLRKAYHTLPEKPKSPIRKIVPTNKKTKSKKVEIDFNAVSKKEQELLMKMLLEKGGLL